MTKVIIFIDDWSYLCDTYSKDKIIIRTNEGKNDEFKD